MPTIATGSFWPANCVGQDMSADVNTVFQGGEDNIRSNELPEKNRKAFM